MISSEGSPTPTGSPHPDGVLPPRQGLVFDIKRFAIHDGPGIRLAVFFKGCNLRCSWCHNPEGIAHHPEKMYTQSRCIGCATCVTSCPAGALSLTSGGIATDGSLCTLCGKCAEMCPSRAMEMSGRWMGVPEIMQAIEKEKVFFNESGGGVTFSGGEPMMQPEVLNELLEECGRCGIHRAVDTAGHLRPEVLMETARRTDLFLYDLKMMDPEKHERWTGVRNDLILENLHRLDAAGSDFIVRIPLMAGINDDEANIRDTAQFLARLDRIRPEVHLLPWHAVARNKYLRLGKPNDFLAFSAPESHVIERTISIFAAAGIVATSGG